MKKSMNCKSNQFLNTSNEETQAQCYSPNDISIISKIFEGIDYYTLDDNGKSHGKFNSFIPDYVVPKQKKWESCDITLPPPSTKPVSRELEDAILSFLVFLGELIIRVIGFQLNAFMTFFTFPLWCMYCTFMFAVDPFRIIRWGRTRTLGVCLAMWCTFCDSVTLPLRGQKSVMKLAMKFCWGFFWSAYVCFLLVGLLALGFVVGGVTMRYIVEEPIQMTETLNFDYTKTSPAAMVPIIACPNELEKLEISQLIPRSQNLKLGISLTLPESDYNQKLGIFQVRVDLLSIDGEVTSGPSYPVMLQFKSQLIRYAETVLRGVPLLAGYSLESQTLNINMKSLNEGKEPISCLKVVLEQRAEYRPGTGIPEIYAASLVVESEMPMIKKMLWHWRKTVFVWISMASFTMELMLALIFCRPVLVPRARARHDKSGKTITITRRKEVPVIKDI